MPVIPDLIRNLVFFCHVDSILLRKIYKGFVLFYSVVLVNFLVLVVILNIVFVYRKA